MNIGLVDVDNHNYPNLALMKISSFHKQKGDHVEWAMGFVPYDKVYMAKVFTFTEDDLQAYQGEIIKGGTGYGLDTQLPHEIEHAFPDYGLYGITDTAYGFLTRGCPRGCDFCIVAAKEGRRSIKVANLSEFWNGQKKIELLDPNILAARQWEDLLGQLAESKAIVNYSQGIDIRLMTDEKVRALNKTKYKRLHFAWDNAADKVTPIMLKEYANAFNVKPIKLMVYVLTNFNSTIEEDLYRIYALKDMGYDPYVMVYDKPNAPRNIRRLQRWVNNKFIFRTVKTFDEYKG